MKDITIVITSLAKYTISIFPVMDQSYHTKMKEEK